jgi:hypothetical protein
MIEFGDGREGEKHPKEETGAEFPLLAGLRAEPRDGLSEIEDTILEIIVS